MYEPIKKQRKMTYKEYKAYKTEKRK